MNHITPNERHMHVCKGFVPIMFSSTKTNEADKIFLDRTYKYQITHELFTTLAPAYV